MTIDRRILAISLACIILASAGCSLLVKSPQGSDRLVITGSSTMAPLIAEIGKRFEEQNPSVRVDVQTGGSSRGISDARRHLADIGMVSRDLKKDESNLRAFAVARDGICLIVHRDNPIAALTDEQVRLIYTGRLSNWSQAGGPDLDITVVHKADGRSTQELFLKYFCLQPTDITPDIVIGDNEQGIKTVAGIQGAVGYVSVGTAEFDRSKGMPIRLLPMNDVAACTEHVADGTYPLSRTLNLVTPESPAGPVRRFIEFAQSPAVHDLIYEQCFVPIKN